VADKRTGRRRDALALAGIAALITWFFWPVIAGRGALFFFDHAVQNFPFRAFFAEGIRAGRLRLWCPDIFCGFPLFAEGQGTPLYPPQVLLFLTLPGWYAYGLLHALHFYFGAGAMYGYLRRHAIGPAGAAAGALAFVFSLPVAAHLHHTNALVSMLWLPALLWAVDGCLRTGRARSYVLLCALIAVFLTGAHPQWGALVLGLTGAYFIFGAAALWQRHGSDAALKALAGGAAAGALALGIFAIAILPLAELIGRSARAGATFGDTSPPAGMLITTLWPNWFGSAPDGSWWGTSSAERWTEQALFAGLLPLGLAALGAWRGRDRWAGFWLAAGLVSLLLAAGSNLVLYPAVSRLPGFNVTRFPTRLAFITAFAVAALAGRGLDLLLRAGARALAGRRLWRVPVAVWAALAGLLGVLMAVLLLPARGRDPLELATRVFGGWEAAGTFRRFFRSTLPADLAVEGGVLIAAAALVFALARLRGRRPRAVAGAALVVLVFAELAWALRGPVAVTDPALYTRRPAWAQGWTPGPARLFRWNISESWSGPGPDGRIDPMAQGWSRWARLYARAGETMPPNMNMLWRIPVVNGFNPLQPTRYRELVGRAGTLVPWIRPDGNPVLNMLGARWILTSAETVPPGWRLVRNGEPRLYENPAALPRAWIVHDARPAPEPDKLVDRLRSGKVDFARVVYIQGLTTPEATRVPAGESARILDDDGDELRLEATLEAPGWLVLADAWAPGWQVRVDGRAGTLHRANHYVRAVRLGPGRHRLVFRYRPDSLRTGALVSVLSLGLLVIFAAIALLTRARIHHPSRGALRRRMRPGARPTILLAALALVAVSPIVCRAKWRHAAGQMGPRCRAFISLERTARLMLREGYGGSPREWTVLQSYGTALAADPAAGPLYRRLLAQLADGLIEAEPRVREQAAEALGRLQRGDGPAGERRE
jgi:hypothetical protein